MKNLLRVLGATVAVFFIIFFVTLTFSFVKTVWFGVGKSLGDHVAVLDVSGMLVDAQPKLRELEELLDNPRVKAVVVYVNSPGGLVAPSQELYSAFKKANEKIPVVIAMGPLAASGGYYISLGGRKIFASPGTLTGSIGVIVEFVNIEKLAQWAKIEKFQLTSGKMKGAGTPFRAMRPDERQLFQDLVMDIYSQFKGAVKEARNLTDEDLVNIADGRVLTGSQAFKAKLIDGIGGIEQALTEARTMAGLPESAPVYRLELEKGILKKYLWGEEASSFAKWAGLFSAQSTSYFFSPAWHVLLVSPVR